MIKPISPPRIEKIYPSTIIQLPVLLVLGLSDGFATVLSITTGPQLLVVVCSAGFLKTNGVPHFTQ